VSDEPLKASPIVPGYRLDRYELLCPVAEGGMASVWVARLRGKHGFEKLVAIKMILPKFAQDVRFERMFLDEAGIASRVTHSNIAQILDLGEEHEILYLAMEWVDGDALSKLVRMVQKKGKDFPPGIALRILADTCGGLHAAHELHGKDGEPMGVVHRDVSPQNILVSQEGVAKLIDFGIAKARDRLGEDTSSGTLKGKIHYMAPEQALGKPVDRRADVWAVGAILYYLLAGKPPYEGDNQLATLHLLASGKPAPTLPAKVHPAIAAIVRRALTHAPDRRYQTASEMHAALESALVEAKIMTTTSEVSAFVREHMADRAKRRKEAIDFALNAAAQRARVAEVMETASLSSSSGISEGADQARVRATVPAVPFARGSEPKDVAAMGALPVALAETSSATLGSAALASPLPRLSMPPTQRRRSALLVAMLFVGLLAGGAVVARSKLRLGQHIAAAVAPPPESPAVTAAPPPGPGANPPTTQSLPDGAATPSATSSTAPTALPRPAVAPSKGTPRVPTSTPANPKKHRIDDGF
jgi:serine/threonine protein kinase